MATELRVPEDLGPARAAEWFRSWSSAAAARELRIVLPNRSALRATALVLLSAGLASRRQRNLTTELAGPDEAARALRSLQPVTDLALARSQAEDCSREL